MKLTDFKVDDRIKLDCWNYRQYNEILFIGNELIFVRSNEGNEFTRALDELDDNWKPFQEPKKMVKRYAYEMPNISGGRIQPCNQIIYYPKNIGDRTGFLRVPSLDYEIEEDECTHPRSGAV